MKNPDNDLNRLVQEVMDHYGVGPTFARSYLSSWLEGTHHKTTNLQEIMRLPPPYPMWFEYIMTTNQRGQNVVQFFKQYFPPTARRYLDVGCGYGGFQIAFSGFGFEAIVVDVDQRLVSLAEANCLDHDLRNCVFIADILDPGLRERFGPFDLITCFDVIEHVMDARLALRNMVSMLNPGGLLMLEIPNKDSINFIAEDGHYSLFGITLLDRPQAIEYHRAIFYSDYGVGEYHELSFYIDHLKQFGCEVEIAATPFHRYRQLDIPFIRHRFVPSYRNYRSAIKQKLPPGLQRQIQISLFRYLYRLLIDRVSYSMKQDRRAFRDKYQIDFWTLLVRKPMEKIT